MTAADVMLWGTRIGTVVFDDKKAIGEFEYDRDFRKNGLQVSPLMMPLSDRVYSFPDLNRVSFHGLPGLLSDSLPDKFGNAVIDAWLQSRGRSPQSFNPVERLCYTGSRGMGALEYVPARGPDSREGKSIELDALVELANDVLMIRRGLHVSLKEDSLQDIIKVGTSAGGARAKAVIAWNPETGDIKSGQIPADRGYGYWLIKFDGVSGNGDKEGNDGPQYTRIEYAYYLMAKDAGIDMEESFLLKENGRFHFMTRRFDRNAETHDKIHMQTLGALAHYDFNSSGSYGYESAARIMRRLGLPQNDVIRFFKRMVFNVFAWNHDDHVKNISFLMDRRGKWSLSPAYDLTYAYNPDGMWTSSHQMTINGKQTNLVPQDLITCGRNMGLSDNEIRKIIESTANSISKWDGFASEAGLSEKPMEEIRRNIQRTAADFTKQ